MSSDAQLRRPRLRWFTARPVAAGVVWGVLQVSLFYGAVVGLQEPQLALLAFPMAFLIGYLLRDLDKVAKAFLVSQGITWLIIVGALDIVSPEFRSLLYSSAPSREAAFTLFVLVGIGILWFLLGLVGSVLGLAVWFHWGEPRKGTKMQFNLDAPVISVHDALS